VHADLALEAAKAEIGVLDSYEEDVRNVLPKYINTAPPKSTQEP
jgi:hypothetical protein